jgi:RND family efflux transporter MFP subunit
MRTSRGKHHFAKVAALLILLSVASAFSWAHEGHKPLPAKGVQVDLATGRINVSPIARSNLGLRIEEVGLSTVEDRLTVPAVLVAPWAGRAFVTTRLPGKITAVHFQVGDKVSAGQALAEVQSSDLENVQLELLQSANEARLSAQLLKQLEQGYGWGAVAEQTISEARSKEQQNRNDLEIARRRLFVLGVDDRFASALLEPRPKILATLPIPSPIAGTITRSQVQVGQVVDLSEHLFEIVDASSVWVKLEVLEKDLPRIAIGNRVEIRLAAYPAPGDFFHSTVRVKGLSLDAKTGEGTVWSELSNPSGQYRFLPGMYGQAEVVLSAEQKTTVPTGALITDGVERFVLVEEGPGQYARQNIVPRQLLAEYVEIQSGQVFPGDRVVTEGSHELRSFFMQGTLRVSPEAARRIGLQVRPAARRKIGDVVRISGIIDLPAGRRAIASARLPGTIERILVDRDQMVRPGDVIAQVRSLEFQNLQLELLRNHLQTQLNEQIVRRIRSVSAGAVPEREMREAESAYRASSQRRESLRRKLQAAGVSEPEIQGVMDRGKFLDALPVRAPIAGAVVQFFHAGIGHSVKAEDPLFEIHDVAHPIVRGFVSERQLAAVRIGQKAVMRLLATPNVVTDGTVVRSSQTLADNDRTLSIWLEPMPSRHADPAWVWLNGMPVRSTLLVSESAPTLAVPVESLLHEWMETYVFVQKSDGSFERRRVKTGTSDDDFVAIAEGLREGEPVAVGGVAELQTGYTSIK